MQRPAEGPSGTKQDLRSFKLILEYIKALPVRPFYFLFFNIFFCVTVGKRKSYCSLFAYQELQKVSLFFK